MNESEISDNEFGNEIWKKSMERTEALINQGMNTLINEDPSERRDQKIHRINQEICKNISLQIIILRCLPHTSNVLTMETFLCKQMQALSPTPASAFI